MQKNIHRAGSAVKNVINQELMRATNKKLILDYIQKHAPVSKSEIALNLGLSATSVSTFTNELLYEEKIISCGSAKSTGGRKSVIYRVNPDAYYVIGLDLQVDAIIGNLFDFQGDVRAAKEIPLESADEWTVIGELARLIQEFIDEAGIPFRKIGGIGIGVPGIVQSEAGAVEFAPNLGWKNVNLRQALGLDCPVFIENEANAAAFGERAFGTARNASNLVYVSIGTGVGCGLILNGKLFAGPTSHAGEFGHMIVEPEGLACRCGNCGCWEVYTSNGAVLKRYAGRSGKTLHSFDDYLDLFLGGDSLAGEVMDETVKYLGIGIANIANGLNPEMIVIGGKIVRAKELIFNPLLKAIKEHCLDKTFSGLTIEFSRLNNRAAVFGVAGMAIERIVAASVSPGLQSLA